VREKRDSEGGFCRNEVMMKNDPGFSLYRYTERPSAGTQRHRGTGRTLRDLDVDGI